MNTQRKQDILAKLAFETQDYDVSDGKVVSRFTGNNPKTMTMSKKEPTRVKGMNLWESSTEVTDSEEKKRAVKILSDRSKSELAKTKGMFGRPILASSSRKRKYDYHKERLNKLKKVK